MSLISFLRPSSFALFFAFSPVGILKNLLKITEMLSLAGTFMFISSLNTLGDNLKLDILLSFPWNPNTLRIALAVLIVASSWLIPLFASSTTLPTALFFSELATLTYPDILLNAGAGILVLLALAVLICNCNNKSETL